MSGATGVLKRLGGGGTQTSVELRQFDEFLGAEKLESDWRPPLAAVTVLGRYQAWLQTRGSACQLASREISAALKRRPQVFWAQRDARAAPLFSFVKFEERPLPKVPAPAPARPLFGASKMTAKELSLAVKCRSLQGKLGRLSQSWRNAQRTNASLKSQLNDRKDAVCLAGALAAKLDRTRRTLERAEWRSKARARAARTFRADKGELTIKVDDLESRLAVLGRTSGLSTLRLEAALRASAEEVIAVRDALHAAREDAVATVDAAEMRASRSAAESARLEKVLKKAAGPLLFQEGGVVCEEVRAAAVAIAAGLDVSIGAVSPVMGVVLDMVEKISQRQRGASLNLTAAAISKESVIRFVHEQGELEKFHIAWRVFMSTSKRLGFKGWALFWDGTSTKYNYRHIMHASIGVGDCTSEYDLSDIVQGTTAAETAAYLKSIVCDVLRRQAVLMVHCGLVGLTYPHEVTVLGMDNEPLNGAAVAEFESFRAISEVLLDMVTCVEEACLNKVDMRVCLDAALVRLKLPPRPPCHDAAREIPTHAELDKKPYVLLNTQSRQRYHDSFGCRQHSIVVAATRFEVVERSQLQGGLAAAVAAHVAEFDGSLALGKACMGVEKRWLTITAHSVPRHHWTRV